MARISRRQFTGMMLAGSAATLPIFGRAQGTKKLTLYMGPPEKTCTAVAQGFEKRSGIKTTFLRLSAGEAINRNLRVLKWLGTTPAIAVCSMCNQEFRVPIEVLKRVGGAVEHLKLEFAQHTCQQSAAPPDS